MLTYPAVPRPITVDVSCVSKKLVLIKFARFAVLTNPPGRMAVPLAVDKYPTVPRPITVDVRFSGVTPPGGFCISAASPADVLRS